MKTKSNSLLAFLLFGIACPAAFGGSPIPVTNPSFESPVVAQDGFSNTLGGWTNPGNSGDSFVERVTRVTAAHGGQYLGINPSASVHQDIGVTYQANTIYLLRVSVGNRPGFSNPGNVARYTLTEPGGVTAISLDTSATENDPGTFRDAQPLYLNTATTSALVSKPIRIRLSALGTAGDVTRRSHFDQVRLERGTAAEFTQVTNTNDSGPGSLREAIANAAAIPGPNTVTFAPSLSGQFIILSSEIAVTESNVVTVDAHNLATLSIHGNSAVRLFALNSGGLILRRLILAGGAGLGSNIAAGGAVRTLAGTTFAAYDCFIHSNSAEFSGGAVSSSGTTTLERCLFALNFTRSNNGTNGCSGAVTNNGTLVARQCTFAGNATFAGTTGGTNANSAGAIYSFGSGGLTLEHCTISGNTAGGDGSVTKGAVIVTTTATVKYSILDGNIGGSDLLGIGASIVRSGANYIGSFSGDAFSGPAPPEQRTEPRRSQRLRRPHLYHGAAARLGGH